MIMSLVRISKLVISFIEEIRAMSLMVFLLLLLHLSLSQFQFIFISVDVATRPCCCWNFTLSCNPIPWFSPFLTSSWISGVDPGFFLGRGAPLRNGITDW